MATGSWPTGGSGFPGIFSGGFGGEGEPTKKFTSPECLQKLMDAINEDPLLVRQHIQIFQSQQNDLLRDKLWPAIFGPENWTRTATKRPTHDDEGEKLMHSDREVRVYENEIWADHGKVLIGTVSTEHGDFLDVKVEVRW